MASPSPWTTGSVTLTDPVEISPSPWVTGSAVLVDPTLLPSSYTTGSVTLTVVPPISGPRVWSHAAKRWLPGRARYHSPGIAWE